jgi:SAM-dependent methyltransferase
MELDPEALQQVVTRTLDHYHARAEAFWEGTRNHDVEQNIEALLRHIQSPAPHSILDFGCGPGRDLLAFTRRGHRVVGLEGAPALAQMALAHSGCEVWLQDFLNLDLPESHFDGVFANASLFHVPRAALPAVLRQLRACLKPRGVLFCSNPRGNDQEGFNGDRYGCFYDLDTWHDHVSAAGFVELHHYFRPPGLPREQQPWLATVWRKVPGDAC